MQIVHLITSFALGGAERVACDLAILSAKAGMQVTVAAMRVTPTDQLDYANHLRKELADNNVKTVEMNAKKFRSDLLTLPLKLHLLLKKEGADILHLHADPADFVGAVGSRFTDVKVIRTIHNTQIWPTHHLMGFLAEKLFKKHNAVAVSHDALQAYHEMRKKYRCDAALKAEVIFNGVPENSTRCAFPDTTMRMAFFGRNAPQKGLDILLSAISSLERKLSKDLIIDIYCDVQVEDIILPQIECLNLNFLAPVSNARQIMGRYSVIIVPSRFEGFGLVAVEAMSAGVPTILADAKGLREVTPTDWPLVFGVEQPLELSNIISDIVSGKYDLTELSKIAFSHAKNFSLREQFERYFAVYKEMLN